MKKFTLLFLILILTGLTYSQEIKVPNLALTEIDFEVELKNFPDSLESVSLTFQSDDYQNKFNVKLTNGYALTEIIIQNSGDYIISYDGQESDLTINVIPGFLSIIPPLIAILLALIFRQVLFSLITGIFFGALFIYDYNPIYAFMHVVDTYIVNALTDKSHVQIIVFTLLFGGVIGLISKSGGTRGIANLLMPLAKNRKSGLFTTWLSGIIIFFDDYANTLIVGNLMRPVTDKLRISREKLAFIVDATSAPVASIFLISSWIGYEVGLIQDGLNIIGSSLNAYNVFIESIPFRFYPIVMLIFIVIMIYWNRDFGPMLKAERNALKNGIEERHNNSKKSDLLSSAELFGNEDRAKWYNGIIPILVIIFGTIAGLIVTGIDSLKHSGITDYSLRDIIAYSDSYLALMWSAFGACVVAAILILSQRIMNLAETMDAWFLGIRSMFLAVLLLTLAWGIGAITQDIKTADYIISIISDSISPNLLPVLVFLVVALTSFSTGTSWGTMAIMMPLVIPLAHSVSELNGLSPEEYHLILVGVISSVLAGCVFGDHCSPISDTTILSSMASSCDHVAHVRTQLPYAVLVGVLCMLIGDIPTAYGFPTYLSIIIISVILFIVVRLIGKKVTPDTA